MATIARAGDAAHGGQPEAWRAPVTPFCQVAASGNVWGCIPGCDQLSALKSLRGRVFSHEPLGLHEAPGWGLRPDSQGKLGEGGCGQAKPMSRVPRNSGASSQSSQGQGRRPYKQSCPVIHPQYPSPACTLAQTRESQLCLLGTRCVWRGGHTAPFPQ